MTEEQPQPSPVHRKVKVGNAFERVLSFCDPVLIPVLGIFLLLTGWRPGTDDPWSGFPNALLIFAVWITGAVLIWNLL